ncbi:hypothetical protein N0V90_003825 [Kalmusia sp. IMI 367209]|nr:hypothetical protein N0V90_003825 [Kalmusia sp. IMI 367209]
MANNERPRRISKAYILGFSSKPYKDPPPPPPLNSYRGMLSTPGAALEWAASDGRRGRLTGKGKPRLLAALDTAAPANKPSKPITADKVATQDVQSGHGGENPVNTSTGQETSGDAEVEYKKNVDNPLNFTEEQDKTLMHMKIDNATWKDIAQKIGKANHECKARFGQIRPDDFFTKGKGGNKAGGQGGQQGNQSNQKQNKQDQKNGEEKKETPADAWGFGGGLDMFGSGGATDDDDAKKDDTNRAADNAGAWAAWGGSAEDNSKQNDQNQSGAAKGDWTGGGGWDFADSNGDNIGTNGTWDNGDASKASVDKDKDSKNSEKNQTQDDSGGGGWNFGGGSDDNNKSKSSSSKNDNNDAHGGGNDGWNNNDSSGGTGWDTHNADGGGGSSGGGGGDWNANGHPSENGGWGNTDSNEKNKNEDKDADGQGNSSWDKDGNNGWGAQPSSKKSPSRHSSTSHEKHRSHKHSSRRHSDPKKDRHGHHSTHAAEYKVAPDSTFSQDELKLIARILQQDCSMVWERVSWRFKDRTGRNLHPDVFEKKITGKKH